MPSLVEISGRPLVDGFREVFGRRSNVLLRTRSQIRDELAASVVTGLSRRPRALESRFLYDERGSELYESITRQPEYYLTRTEAALLRRHAGAIRDTTGPVTIIELGSGSAVKTQVLLGAYVEGGAAARYVPVDVSDAALVQAAADIEQHHPTVSVVSVHGTFETAIKLLGCVSPVMGVFLGSSIANLDEDEERRFWARAAGEMKPGGFFLLGVDLVKAKQRLDAAYDDAAGVTAAFTKNLFVRMNRELGAGLDVEAIAHEAEYVPERERVEIHARFRKAQTLHVRPLKRRFRLSAGERVLVEISRKYRVETLTPRLEAAGFGVRQVFTDPAKDFALLLLQRSFREPER